MGTVLMCKPVFFDVPFKLNDNSCMDPENRPDNTKAKYQWQVLVDNYEKFGVEVLHARAQYHIKHGLYDMTFTANAGLLVRDWFFVSKFKHEHRRPESRYYSKYFHEFYPHELNGLIEPEPEGSIIFEGQGDAFLVDPKTLVITHGVRTNFEGVNFITDAVKHIDSDIKIVPLKLVPESDYRTGEMKFYHGDLCLLHLKSKRIFLVYFRPFADRRETLRELNNLGRVYEVDKDAAESFLLNSVEVNPETIFTPTIKKEFWRRFLRDLGYKNVIEHDMFEFMKSGGAVKCLTLEL